MAPALASGSCQSVGGIAAAFQGAGPPGGSGTPPGSRGGAGYRAGPISMMGRTSTEPPTRTAGIREAIAIASSRLLASTM